MVYRTASFPMTLNDPILDAEYLRNGTR